MRDFAYFTFNKKQGWRVFYVGKTNYSISKKRVRQARQERGALLAKVKEKSGDLLFIEGPFKQRLTRGKFCKRPHKLMLWRGIK
jgi:hypothetical protein